MVDAQGSRRARRWLLVALVVCAVALVVADLAAQAYAEDQVAEAVVEATGFDAAADIRGRPFLWRAAFGTLTEVRIDATASDAQRVSSAVLRLEEVDVAARRLLSDGVLDLEAPSGQLDLALADGYRPLGVGRLALELDDVTAELADQVSAMTAGTVTLTDPDERVDAVAAEVDLDYDERASSGAGSGTRGGRSIVRLAQLRADLRGDALPLEVDELDLRAGALELRHRAAGPTEVQGGAVQITGRDVPVGELGARASRLDIDLPSLTAEHDGEAPGELRTPGGRFDVSLGQDAVDGLWEFPGAVVLRDGSARLEVAGVGLDLRIRADEQGRVAIEPVVPGLLSAVVPSLGVLAFPPPLPPGMTLDGIDVRDGELVLRGQAERWTLPDTAP